MTNSLKEDLDNHKDWSSRRRFIARVITDGKAELVLATLVFFSLALIIVEADHKARDEDAPYWVKYAENTLLLMYSVEMVLRLYVLRREFFTSALNVVDLVVVLIDTAFFFVRLASIELPKFTFLRVLRLAKISRAFHILVSQEPLYIMMEAFLASLQTLFFGCTFIAVALVIYAIIAVEFLLPLDVEFSTTCGVCQEGFMSVYKAICTLIQTTIIGDEWGDMFRPYLLEYPQTLLFILPVFVSVNFGLMNLIMAVIVDSAAQARIHNTKRIALEKDREFKQNQKHLYKLCEEMDSDGSKSITMKELLTAFESNIEFKLTLHAMDIEKEDLEAVFNILDDDASGDVQYEEFVSQLYKMKTNNSNTMLVFIKHYITEVRKNVGIEMQLMKDVLAGGIAQLQQGVSEELNLIKSDIKMHIQDPQKRGTPAATPSIQTEQKEQKEQKESSEIPVVAEKANTVPPLEELVLRSQVAAAISTEQLTGCDQLRTVTEKIVLNLQDLRQKCEAESQLQMAMNQIDAAVDDLRRNCQTSYVLLSSFHGLLPRTNSSGSLSAASPANSSQPGRITNSLPKGDHADSQGSQSFSGRSWSQMQPPRVSLIPTFPVGAPKSAQI